MGNIQNTKVAQHSVGLSKNHWAIFQTLDSRLWLLVFFAEHEKNIYFFCRGCSGACFSLHCGSLSSVAVRGKHKTCCRGNERGTGGEAGDEEEEEEELQGIYFDLGAETQEQSSGGSG